jgi:hypothetical protein
LLPQSGSEFAAAMAASDCQPNLRVGQGYKSANAGLRRRNRRQRAKAEEACENQDFCNKIKHLKPLGVFVA